jgi:regulator of sigma E protease
MVMAIITFMAVLGILVVFHEFGHFSVARLCGVQVQTFSVGFGPKLWSKKSGPTEYCISAIPLGGYVRMLGDDPTEEIAPEERDRSFLTQPVGKKIAIVVAGPFFNLMLAFFIFAGVLMAGVPLLLPNIGEVQKGSAAEAGGLEAGDRVLKINDKQISEWEEIRGTLQESNGAPLRFTVLKKGAETVLTVTPTRKKMKNIFGDEESLWLVGISPSGDQFTKKHSLLEAIPLGLVRTIDMAELNLVGIVKMIEGKISSDNIGGPILIGQMAAKQAEEGFLHLALFTAFISINLGVINLFPIPILDGGHLLFFLIEAIIGRPVSLRAREVAQQIGLFLLISLMLFAFYNDIMRLLA